MVGGTVNQNPGIMSLTAIIKATAANSLSPPAEGAERENYFAGRFPGAGAGARPLPAAGPPGGRQNEECRRLKGICSCDPAGRDNCAAMSPLAQSPDWPAEQGCPAADGKAPASGRRGAPSRPDCSCPVVASRQIFPTVAHRKVWPTAKSLTGRGTANKIFSQPADFRIRQNNGQPKRETT
jgi:hypothetical protein